MKMHYGASEKRFKSVGCSGDAFSRTAAHVSGWIDLVVALRWDDGAIYIERKNS